MSFETQSGGVALELPLIAAAFVFLVFILYRLRPVLDGEGGREARAALKAAVKRIDDAKTDDERVEALCAAADASAKLVSGGGRAVQFYLRAMKLAPKSADVVERAARGMLKRPRGLENLLWRRIGTDAWKAEEAPVIAAALAHLATLYAGPLKSSVRARAFSNMLAAINDRAVQIKKG
ncbi:MAG: hypothetical protein IPG50_08995 [Myxococcales bacterium]|nr:hypothetical protein [Myxococcales bacterium]